MTRDSTSRPTPKVAALIVLPPLAGYGPDRSQLLGAMDAPPDWELELYGSPEGGHKRPMVAVALPPGWELWHLSMDYPKRHCKRMHVFNVPIHWGKWRDWPTLCVSPDGDHWGPSGEVPELLYEAESQTITEIDTRDISACP